MSSSGDLTLATPAGDVYTCEPVELQWTYSGPSGTADYNPTMALAVNQFRLPENSREELDANARVPPPEDVDDPVVRILSQTLAVRAGVFEWDQVDLPSGMYYLSGWTLGDNPAFSTSRSFRVNNGSDISCVDESPENTDTNTNTPTGSPSDTSDPGQSSPPPTDTEGSTQPTVDPETNSAISSSSVNKGAIAGGVVAGVFALVIAALILFLCRRRHRNRDHSRRAQHGYMNSRGKAGLKDDDKFGSTPSKTGARKGGSKWTGLGSVDLKSGGAGKEATTPAANSRRNSTNPLTGNTLGLTMLNREPGAVSPTEDDDAKYSLGGESASSLGHGVLKLVEHDAPFIAYTPRNQSLDQDRHRSPSQPSPPSLSTSPISTAEPYPSHNYAYHPNRRSFHAMPTDVSNGGTGPRKKAPRKPVPAYASGAEPTAMGVSHGSPPSLATGSTMVKSSSYGSTSPIAESNDQTQFSPQLESSLSAMGLGGKDVHHLIPDMPVGYQRSHGYGKQGSNGEDWQAGRR